MKDQKKRAWFYCRIDAPEDVHGIIKKQKKELLDYAEQMGFKIIGSSEDMGSGLDFSRPGLLEVMKEAGEGKFDVLLVKRFDLLGRDALKTLEFMQGLDQLGIQIYSPLEGHITLSQSTNLFHNLTLEIR